LDLKQFKQNSASKVLLYLENVEMSPFDLTRSILTMSFHGVFEVIDGLLLGRNMGTDSKNSEDLQYIDVINNHLKNKKIPVIYDMDIGHFPPNLTLINGAQARVTLRDEKGLVQQALT
jgi:muramoyltetrapeptide carboxypeptidase LdcA involved in peptidoglycan recycling